MTFGKGRGPSQAAARPRRALFCWEYGSGHTHLANILAVAERLREAGAECLAALHDTRAGARFETLGIPVVQTCVWPQARRWVPHDRERRHAGFLDVLGNLGFAEPDWVAGAIAHYNGLFALFEPDLVLAENAYGALLAARGRVPAIAFGFGAYLPAIADGCFAVPETEPTSWGAAEVLAGLNAGMARAGRPTLRRLEQMFGECTVHPFGPAAFDPNAPLRGRAPLGAHVPGFRPGIRGGTGTEVFVYLQGRLVRNSAVTTALRGLGRPIRAYIPDLDPADRMLLAEVAILEEGPLPIEAVVRRSRCVLHHGGVGLAAACLAAGVPQVVLSTEPEQRASGGYVAWHGLGDHRAMSAVDAAWLVETVRWATSDADLAAACRARAAEHDAWFAPDPVEAVVSDARLILGRVGSGSRSIPDGPAQPPVP